MAMRCTSTTPVSLSGSLFFFGYFLFSDSGRSLRAAARRYAADLFLR